MKTQFRSLSIKPAMLQATVAWSHASGRMNSIPGMSGSIEGAGYA
jgi:hypothetical protein